jgi:hypothetical protein
MTGPLPPRVLRAGKPPDPILEDPSRTRTFTPVTIGGIFELIAQLEARVAAIEARLAALEAAANAGAAAEK